MVVGAQARVEKRLWAVLPDLACCQGKKYFYEMYLFSDNHFLRNMMEK